VELEISVDYTAVFGYWLTLQGSQVFVFEVLKAIIAKF
jgi:hypothetical protein